MKKCNKCDLSKPHSEFGKKSDNRDGLRTACNDCRKIERAEYNAANRDRNRAYGREHYAANRESIARRAAKYYVENKDRINRQHAEYRAAHPEVKREYMAEYSARPEVKLRQAEYREGNREAIAAYRADNPQIFWESRYRHRSRGFGFEPVVVSFTRDELIARWGDECFHCKGEWTELDHWPQPVGRGGPHTLENARPSCTPCNRRSWRTNEKASV